MVAHEVNFTSCGNKYIIFSLVANIGNKYIIFPSVAIFGNKYIIFF